MDVGAHNGFFSVAFCASQQTALAIAYEPSLLMANAIQTLISRNAQAERVRYRQVALSDSENTMELFLDVEGGFAQVAPFPFSMGRTVERIVVPVTSVDAECARMHLKPTLLKVDVEGYEWEVLRGAAETLREHRPKLFLELHLDYLEHRGISPMQVLRFLEQLGYGFRGFDGRERSASEISDSTKSVERFISVAR